MDWKKKVRPLLLKYKDINVKRIPVNVRKHFGNLARRVPASYIARGLAHTFNSEETAPFADMLTRLFFRSNKNLRLKLLNSIFSQVPYLSPEGSKFITYETIKHYTSEAICRIMLEAVKSSPSVVVLASDIYSKWPNIVRALSKTEIGILLAGMAALPDPATQLVGQTAPEETAPYVNFKFLDVSNEYQPRPLLLHQGFEENRIYRMIVSMELAPDERVVGEHAAIERPESSSDVVELDVALITESSSIRIMGDPSDVMKWPQYGPSSSDGHAIFVIEALQVTTEENPARLDVYIYHHLNLLFTARLSFSIKPVRHAWQRNLLPIRWQELKDCDKDRTVLFQRFSSLNSIAKRDLNLAIQRGMEDDYLVTAYIGRMELPVRVKISRQEIGSHLLEARRLLDELRLNPVYVSQGFDAQGNYTGQYSGTIYDDARKEVSEAEARKVFERFMRNMAIAGSQFWGDLFSTASARRLHKIICETLPEGALIQIWLEDAARDFLYPWHWLYVEAVDQSIEFNPDPQLFWGYKYIIEIMPRFDELARYDPPQPQIPSEDRVLVKIGTYNFIETETQKTFFTDWARISDGALTSEVWDEANQWISYFPNCDCQIIYFFSHGHTALPTNPGEVSVYKMAQALEQYLEQRNTPAQSSKVRHYEEQLKNSLQGIADRATQTFIKLRRGYLYLRNLHNFYPRDPVPLVFLNMCESAQVFPSMTDGLVDVFLTRRARGVIGTEMPMIPHFADLFARRFFKAFFSKSLSDGSIGRILFELRREFLNTRNPLGFAYTFFGDSTTHLSHPISTRSLNSNCIGGQYD